MNHQHEIYSHVPQVIKGPFLLHKATSLPRLFPLENGNEVWHMRTQTSKKSGTHQWGRTGVGYPGSSAIFPALNYLDYEQSPFFLCPSSKTPETRKWPRAWLKARDGRGKTLSRAAALVSRVSRLRRSTLARGCTTLAKSELPNAAPLLCLTRLCVPFFLTNEYNYDWRQAYWYRQISSKFGKR